MYLSPIHFPTPALRPMSADRRSLFRARFARDPPLLSSDAWAPLARPSDEMYDMRVQMKPFERGLL